MKLIITLALLWSTMLLLSLNPSRSDSICGDPPSTGYTISCNNIDGSTSARTTKAIDQVLDGLLNTKFFEDGNFYCDKSSTAHPMIYGYIYCPSTDKKACQDDLSYGYDNALQAQCGRYRVGAMVVGSDGSCLRFEKYMFC